MNRVRPGRFLLFITFWFLFVYIPVARWSWYPNGVFKFLGTMDFAGGTPVHIVSGTTVAAFAIFYSIETRENWKDFTYGAKQFLARFLRRYTVDVYWHVRGALLVLKINFDVFILGREISDNDLQRLESLPIPEERSSSLEFEPYNVNYLVLGTALLWFGWAGFNGGSALSGNLRAVSAWFCTHSAACSGGVTAVILLWVRKSGTWFQGWLAGRDSPARGDGDDAADSSPTTARASSPAAGGHGAEHGVPVPDEEWIKEEKGRLFEDMTALYFCDGVIAGLVAITPAAGYVSLPPLGSRVPTSTSWLMWSRFPSGVPP